MSKVSDLEEEVHGRRRQLADEGELRFGVTEEMLYARATPPVEGAQWTGLVTRIAIAMLESGAVDAVVCVQSDENDRCGSCTLHLCQYPVVPALGFCAHRLCCSLLSPVPL